MKAMTFDKSFAEKKDTLANLIANLSRMVLTTSERLFYIKLLTRGFRSTPIYMYDIYNIYYIYIYAFHAKGPTEIEGPYRLSHRYPR